MDIYYFYLILLIGMFLLVSYAINCSIKFAPSKIKIVSSAAILFISFRYIGLLIFLLTKNIRYLYLLKPIIFLNLLCIPVLAMVSIYILSRNDRIKFDYCIAGAIVLLFSYIMAIIKFPVIIEVYKTHGYIIYFSNNNLIYGIYLMINTVLFFGAVAFLENKNSNKIGMWLILISAFITVLELILNAFGIKIIPTVLFGDILWIITAIYALNRLRK